MFGCDIGRVSKRKMTINALKAVCALTDEEHLDNMSQLNLSVALDSSRIGLDSKIFDYAEYNDKRYLYSPDKETPRSNSILK